MDRKRERGGKRLVDTVLAAIAIRLEAGLWRDGEVGRRGVHKEILNPFIHPLVLFGE